MKPPSCLLCLLLLLIDPVCPRQQALRLPLGDPVNGSEPKHMLSQYYSNTELAHHMKWITGRCGGIARVFHWGKSSRGVELLALELYSGNVSEHLRPSFKYVGNVHGDEPSGRQLLLALADHLCKAYADGRADARRLLATVGVVLIPSMNPDGFDLHTRENALKVDLNRNFPDPNLNKGRDLRRPTGQEQAETLAMMELSLARRFVGSLAIHEGAVVANYPFDGYTDGSHESRHAKHATPDDTTFVYLAKLYAALHTNMAAPSNKEFPSGITNGAQWYPIYGGMQDWNYLAAGCMELTLELNEDKWPDLPRLAQMWDENSLALVQYPLELVLGGLSGTVSAVGLDGQLLPLVASVHVQGQGMNVTSAATGHFYRPLAPGRYTVLVEAAGHAPTSIEVTVPTGGHGLSMVVELKELALAAPPMARQDEAGGGGGTLSGLHVMVYVLGAPLLAGAALILWRRSGHEAGKRMVEPWYAMVEQHPPTRPSPNV